MTLPFAFSAVTVTLKESVPAVLLTTLVGEVVTLKWSRTAAAAVCSAGSTAAFNCATSAEVLPYTLPLTVERCTNGVIGVNEITTVTLIGSPYVSVVVYTGVPGGLGYG